ncbi:sulfatase [Draconibacterium orientale]|uniref:sulfatase n=1 Tax=Draconibacterium orientale TaxID=1168034 RepID=UPI002ABD815D|nr:sulfatase [Draconibacterium orientale]
MKVIRYLLAGVLCFCFVQHLLAGRKITKKPNILLINVDDLGWNNTGFMGSEYYETPNLDALARDAIIFTNAYAVASNCAPSRACLMSGQWTPRHGIYTVDSSERGKSKNRKLIPTANTIILPDSQYVVAEALHDAGYYTCHAGKWHISDDPTTQGFDVNIGGCHSGSPKSYYPPYLNVPLNPPTDDYYLTNLVMDKTVEFIETVGDEKPFFLNYWPYAVHTPLQPIEKLMDKYQNKPTSKGHTNANYAAMIENLDTQIGRLIAALKAAGKFNNTFIIFTSDNGGRYATTKQWPLRSGKGAYYEGGTREPTFVYWKGKIKGGERSDIPITQLDFYPTLLDVAGVKKPVDKVLDGQSIYPLLMGKKRMKERPLFWHFPIYLQAQVKGGDPSTQDPLFRTRPGSSVRLGDWKLIQYFENNDLELYNLKEDVGEENNLAEQDPKKTKQLLELLEDWRKETKAPVPSELNPGYQN